MLITLSRAAQPGFGPGLMDSKSTVLPLDDRAMGVFYQIKMLESATRIKIS